MSNLDRLGGWSAFSSDISKDAQEAFDQAMKGWAGGEYTPVAVAQQVVAGMNYAFFCNSVSGEQRPTRSAAMVYIYQPLPGQGGAEVQGIVPTPIEYPY